VPTQRPIAYEACVDNRLARQVLADWSRRVLGTASTLSAIRCFSLPGSDDYAASNGGKMEGHGRRYCPQSRIARLSPPSNPLRNPWKTAGRISLRAPLRCTTPHCGGTGHSHQTV